MTSKTQPRPGDPSAEAARFVRHREIMAEFGSKALQLGDFDALFQEACERTAEGIGVEHAKILEYRLETDDLLVCAGIGWAENVVGHARLSAGMASPPGRAFRTGQPVFIEDIRETSEFEYSELLRAHGVVALVNVPIKTDNFTFGVLEVDGDAPRRFSADDRNFLLGFANLVAAAVERKRHDVDLSAATEERERLLADLHRARDAAEAASASKSQLLAAAAHDLRQPLQSLMLSLDLLARRVQDPVDRKRVAQALHAAGGIDRALDRFVAFSHLESGQVEPQHTIFALDPLLAGLDETFRPLAEAAGLALRVEPANATIRSDPALLEEILQNIIGNAIKYTESGSVVISCERRDRSLSIEVRDTGIGMPSDQIEAAFQEFLRLDSGRGTGLGLGLSIVRRLSDLLGHPVTVRSQPGEGTCVAVEVPIAAEKS
jgi:signal transduction histidine kinase